METKTKFNLGDTIVGIKDNKLFTFKVTGITTSAYLTQDGETLNFTYYQGEDASIYEEKNCFPSREAYINQL